MATKPSVAIPTWATNATYAAGEESGSANKVAPPTAQREDGWRPGERPPAQYENHERNAIGEWLEWAEESIDDLDARFDGDGDVVYPSPLTVTIYRGTEAARLDVPANWTRFVGNGYLQSAANAAQLALDLAPFLPRTSSIVRVRALVDPGAARATAGNRMGLQIHETGYGASFASPAITNATQAIVRDDGTADLQWITCDFSGSPLAVSARQAGRAVVTCGNDAGSNLDLVYGFALDVLHPGIDRN